MSQSPAQAVKMKPDNISEERRPGITKLCEEIAARDPKMPKLEVLATAKEEYEARRRAERNRRGKP